MKSYRELKVWIEAMNLVESIYSLTKLFPKGERYGITSQIQRAAVSIPANIAEGYDRSHRKEYLNHLSISMGSLLELETHLLIAKRINLISKDSLLPIWKQSQYIGILLSSLQKSLRIKKDQNPET